MEVVMKFAKWENQILNELFARYDADKLGSIDKVVMKFVKWENQWGGLRPKFEVKLNGSKFNFWGSAAPYGKGEVTDDLKKYATECIYRDALSYAQFPDPFDFIEELGYTDLQESKKVYRGCKEAYEKLGYSEEELIDLLNELEDN